MGEKEMGGPDTIELHDEELQEVMGKIPNWIVRWGITVILATIMLILLGTWFFKYPDIINSTIMLTTNEPPSSVIAGSSGKIDRLMVGDKQPVKAGAVLAVLQNTARYDDVMAVKHKLVMVSADNTGDFPVGVDFSAKNYVLGELREDYTRFVTTYEDCRRFFTINSFQRKIEAGEMQLSRQEVLRTQHMEKINIQKQILSLSVKEFERNKTLLDSGIIALQGFEKMKRLHLEQQSRYEDARFNLMNLELSIAEQKQSLLKLQIEKEEEEKRLVFTFKESLKSLAGRIAAWERQSVLKAPIDGVVTLTKYWSESQHVTLGETVMTVVPGDATGIIGKVKLPIAGSGKVKEGQEVNIKFANYPHLEYGIVKGSIEKISLIPEGDFYVVEVSLPNGLTTTYNKVLAFAPEIQGTAEIIVEDVRLIQRFLRPFHALIKQHI